MTDPELQSMLRQAARRQPSALPADFSTSVLARLGPQDTGAGMLPLLTAASALALALALLVASWPLPVSGSHAPQRLAIFHSNPERAPFSAP